MSKPGELKAEKDMTVAMEETLQRLHGRFQSISEQLESKNILLSSLSLVKGAGEMGTRINDLEENVSDLMTQAGMEEQPMPK